MSRKTADPEVCMSCKIADSEFCMSRNRTDPEVSMSRKRADQIESVYHAKEQTQLASMSRKLICMSRKRTDPEVRMSRKLVCMSRKRTDPEVRMSCKRADPNSQYVTRKNRSSWSVCHAKSVFWVLTITQQRVTTIKISASCLRKKLPYDNNNRCHTSVNNYTENLTNCLRGRPWSA